MRTATLTFVADGVPPVKPGNLGVFLVTTRSPKGALYTSPAYYLNAYPLDYPDGCGECALREKCEAEDGDGCPTTGWFQDNSNFDYENCYYKISDEILEWAAIPQPEQDQ